MYDSEVTFQTVKKRVLDLHTHNGKHFVHLESFSRAALAPKNRQNKGVLAEDNALISEHSLPHPALFILTLGMPDQFLFAFLSVLYPAAIYQLPIRQWHPRPGRFLGLTTGPGLGLSKDAIDPPGGQQEAAQVFWC